MLHAAQSYARGTGEPFSMGAVADFGFRLPRTLLQSVSNELAYTSNALIHP
ncbi:hypothetical protein GCM10009775_11580 [Microbacterium aoyamense]|uniref:Uncharacterized protein n=1 Tax=Microbacterium aoyamense TaxID=344166 RepID=A0ABP5ARP7_9MICO